MCYLHIIIIFLYSYIFFYSGSIRDHIVAYSFNSIVISKEERESFEFKLWNDGEPMNISMRKFANEGRREAADYVDRIEKFNRCDGKPEEIPILSNQ